MIVRRTVGDAAATGLRTPIVAKITINESFLMILRRVCPRVGVPGVSDFQQREPKSPAKAGL
jgi:hypothetical protein